MSELRERRGRRCEGERATPGLPGKRRHDFDACNAGDVNSMVCHRVHDAEHPSGARLTRVPLYESAAVEEIGRHLATLLQDNLGERFAGGFDGLSVLVWGKVGDGWFDVAEDSKFHQLVRKRFLGHRGLGGGQERVQ
jgi:hypothetical protein